MIIPEIVTQHAEEAAFQWLLRDSAVTEPHYSLKDLANLDDRVEAHIDGLRIAGDAGWEICKEAMAEEEAGEIFAASVLAFESGIDNRIETVLDVGNKDPELARGIISALGWIPFETAANHIQSFINDESSFLCRIGIAASAIHRQDPGEKLFESIASDDPLLKSRALKAAGELGSQNLLSVVTDNLSSTDDKIRFYAAWSGALLGSSDSIPVLRAIAENDSPYADRASAMALRLMNIADARNWLKELIDIPDKIRQAVCGIGIIGDSANIPLLIEIMKLAELARIAGEAFTMITGLDLAYEDLEGEWPEGFEAGPTESPEDEDVEMDPDEDLPWPAPALIAGWWNSKKGEFRNETRYLLGQPIASAHLQHVLRTGFQRQRAAAAIELAILNPGRPLFEVRAPGFRQQKSLGLK